MPAPKIIKPEKADKTTTLLMGRSGVGKTYQYRKLHEAGFKILVIASERKLLTIAGLKPDIVMIDNFDFPTSKGEVVQSDLLDVFNYLRTPGHKYDLVFWDGPMRWSEDLSDYLSSVKRLSGYDLWGIFAKKVEKALKHFTLLADPASPVPVHVVATWGVEHDKDWQANKSAVPIIDGQRVKPRISFWFDNVLYVEKLDDVIIGTSKFVLNTTGSGRFEAKISIGALKFDAVIENPNLAEIL